MMLMDKRQRAMLKEMGVRVWQPQPDAVVSAQLVAPTTPVNAAYTQEIAIDSGASRTRIQSIATPFNIQKLPQQVAPTTVQAENTVHALAWRVGVAQTLYADTSIQNAARWLLLLEAPASALHDSFNPLDGDAGKLLDNMLRAACLHTASTVLLAPLVRSGAIGSGSDLPGALTELLATTKADVVLVMGRLAVQALLQSTEPLARLRGQIHTVKGKSVVITIDPTYLLRNPLDKAKAWDDLCLAISAAEPSR